MNDLAQRPERAGLPSPALSPVASGRRLLIVDDEEGIRTAIGRFLGGRGYEVYSAEAAAPALELLARHRCALMLCDVRLPDMSGLELVPLAREADPELAIVMLTALSDATTATAALTQGAVDYLTKPVDLPVLERAIERALHQRELVIRQRSIERRIREEVALRTAELERQQATLQTISVSVAEALIHAMEAKDIYLLGHSQRVAELAASVASQLGLGDDTVECVRVAGRLHDVGKIGIREAVLNKPGALTPEEFEHVKEHVRIGMQILAPLEHLGQSLTFVQDHHEHWDGGGYPRALSGSTISIGGRILAAADAFDALTSRRAYREPLTPEQTIEFLAGQAGRLLDPEIYAAMRSVVERRQSLMFIDPHA